MINRLQAKDGRQRLGGLGYWVSRDGIATRTRVANAQSRSRLLHALAMREWEHGVRARDTERRLRPLCGAVGSRRVAMGSRTRRGGHTIGGAKGGSEKSFFQFDEDVILAFEKVICRTELKHSFIVEVVSKVLLTSSCVTGNCRSSLLRNCMDN